MLAELTNHIWQSTVFAAVAGLMILFLRKNRAQVRYWVWLSASLKFLVPFFLLVSLGSRIERVPVSKNVSTPAAVSFALVQITEPFPATSPTRPFRETLAIWLASDSLVSGPVASPLYV